MRPNQTDEETVGSMKGANAVALHHEHIDASENDLRAPAERLQISVQDVLIGPSDELACSERRA